MMIQLSETPREPKQRNFVFESFFEELCPCCYAKLTGEILDRRCPNTAECEIAQKGIVITGEEMAGKIYDHYHPDCM